MEQFNFCFSFNKICLLNNIESSLFSPSAFRVQLRRYNEMLGSTSCIPYKPNHEDEIAISNQMIQLRMQQKNRKAKQAYELRLIQMRQQSEQILIGSYQFVLYNYITAYKELRRSCVELTIQISQNYAIDYEVYIERTKQALKRIIDEHVAARKLSFTETLGEDQFFYFRQQNTNDIHNQQIKEIKMGDISPIFLKQRFWSPIPKKPAKHMRLKTVAIPDNSKLCTNQQTVESSSNRKSFTKIEEKDPQQISLDPQNKLSVSLTGKNIKNLLQMSVDCESENEGQEQNLEQLYDVIQMGSKILAPGDENSVIIQPSRHLQQRQKAKLLSTTFSQSSNDQNSRNVSSSKFNKYFFILLLFFLLTTGIIHQIMRPNVKTRSKKYKKTHRKK